MTAQTIKVFVFGRDNVGWSIDRDREAIINFLELNNFEITRNILEATHIFCVWYDLLLAWKYKWILYLKKLLNKKLFAVITNDITIFPKKLDLLKKYVNVFVSPSHRIYEFLKEKKIKVVLIPFFVDPNIFNSINLSKEDICKKLRIDYSKIKNKTIIGSFVRDSLGRDLDQPKWQKNPDLLITILSNLPKEKYLLLLAGPRRHYIIQKCKGKNIPFLFYGQESLIYQQKDDVLINNLDLSIINYLYNLSDIYIISSKNEGGPKQVLESALTKTLVFSTKVGLVPDFIHPYLIYEENELLLLIEKIKSFLEDKKNFEECIEYNFLKTKQEMDSNKLKEKYKKLFLGSHEN